VTSTITATTSDRPARGLLGRADSRGPRRWLYPALAIGMLWGFALTYVELATTTTTDGHPFHHAADYWLTGLGIALCLSGLVIVHAMHAMAGGRDGRRGRWGVWVFTAPALVFTALFVDGVVQAQASSWGPTYLLCVLATDVGLGLLVAGLCRSGLLPRKVLALWWVGWFVGGPLGPPAAPLLLTAAYVAFAVQLRRSE
jgi:hypothetical protein